VDILRSLNVGIETPTSFSGTSVATLTVTALAELGNSFSSLRLYSLKQIYMTDTFLLSAIWGVNQIINRSKFLKNCVRSTIFSLQRITR